MLNLLSIVKRLVPKPNFANTFEAGCLKPSKYTSPSPNNGNDKCANGAKSPEAPNELECKLLGKYHY